MTDSNPFLVKARIHVYKNTQILTTPHSACLLPEVLITSSIIINSGEQLIRTLKTAVKTQTGVDVKIKTLTTISNQSYLGFFFLDFLAEYLCEPLHEEPGMSYFGAIWTDLDEFNAGNHCDPEIVKSIDATKDCKYYVDNGSFCPVFPEILVDFENEGENSGDIRMKNSITIVAKYPKTRKSIHFCNTNVEWAQLTRTLVNSNEIEDLGFKNPARAGVFRVNICRSGMVLHTLYKVDFKQGAGWKLINLDNGGREDSRIVQILEKQQLLPYLTE